MTRSGYLLDLAGFLELGGAAVAGGAVQPGAVVPADVFHDRPLGHGSGWPGLEVEQLAFDGGEEALGEGVVPALAGAAMGQHYGIVSGQGRELGGGVWQPLSAWKITPGPGSRAATALASAAATSSVRRWAARA